MQIAPDLLQQIIDHALRDAPNECCGFVFLRDGVAEEVVAVENMAPSPFRFEIGSRDLLTLGDADADGREAIIYHSHTRSAPRPSQTDINFAVNWPGVEWLIVGTAGAEPEVRNWRIDPTARSPRSRSRSGPMPGSEPLVCPSCATPHPLEERFCRDCGMPLVYAGSLGVDAPVTDRQEWARKIKPQLAEGELTKVASGRNQAEAELIQGLLLEEGVPSMLKRSAGLRRPRHARGRAARRDGSALGRRGRARGADAGGAAAGGSPGSGVDSPARILVGLLSAIVLVALIAWIGTELVL